jgi:DNA modification methylase
MERETVKISALKAAPYNPRQISGEALAGLSKSLERWGVVQEVVANRQTGYIVGGHQRVAALKKMGVKEVPVVWVDLDDVEEKALNVALNNPHISGEFDDTIAGLLTEIRDGIGPDDFESLMLDDLLPPEATVVEGNTDPDDVPEAPEEPITKPGDLWILGDHRLLCGDSTNIQHVERLMGGQKADMVFTDPPYGINMQRSGSIKGDASMREAENIISGSVSSASIASKKSASWYFWVGFRAYGFTELEISKHRKISNCIVWKKPSIGMGHNGYRFQHEMCVFTGKVENRGISDVWEFGRDTSSLHPTMKPVDLVCYALENSSVKGDEVLDLFGGSGSTLIACEKTNRQCKMMELDPKYCDVIVKRWEDFTGKKAKLEEANDATG